MAARAASTRAAFSAELGAAGDGLGVMHLASPPSDAFDDLDGQDNAVGRFEADGIVETKESREPRGSQGLVTAGGFDFLGEEEGFDGRTLGVGHEAVSGVCEGGGDFCELVGFALCFAGDGDGLVFFDRVRSRRSRNLEEDAGRALASVAASAAMARCFVAESGLKMASAISISMRGAGELGWSRADPPDAQSRRSEQSRADVVQCCRSSPGGRRPGGRNCTPARRVGSHSSMAAFLARMLCFCRSI